MRTPVLECRAKKRPKIKGCYECSRRRIDCDRTAPQCAKCEHRGLKCSGLGPRYRFNDGVASRGKLAGKHVPVLIESTNSPIAAATQTNSSRPLEVAHSSLHLQCLVHRPIDHLDGQTRSYLKYFSEHIAPIMAVIDKGFNGYRDLILPLAEENPLVRNAILTSSIHHLSIKTGAFIVNAHELYNQTLRGLLDRSWSSAGILSQDETSLVTILLLLVCEMITGGDNFNLLYKSLKSYLRISGGGLGIRSTELGNFLKLQTYRVQLYAESLLSEVDGYKFVSIQASKCFEFLRFCRSLHPEYNELVSRLEELINQACHIYIHRIVNDLPPSYTVHLVERFKQAAEKILPESIGQNVLVWSYFIVAAESSIPEHRKFFIDRIQSLYYSTGFLNSLKGLTQLEKIWDIQSGTRWTSLLGGPGQALIM